MSSWGEEKEETSKEKEGEEQFRRARVAGNS